MLQTVVVLVPVVTLFLLLNSDFSGSTGAACRPRLSVSAVTVMRRRRGYHSAKAEPMSSCPGRWPYAALVPAQDGPAAKEANNRRWFNDAHAHRSNRHVRRCFGRARGRAGLADVDRPRAPSRL